MPNTKIEIQITLESDSNVIWQAGANCCVLAAKFKLLVPKIIFTSVGEGNIYEPLSKTAQMGIS